MKTVADLSPNPKNPRKIDAAALKALQQSLEVFGDLGGVVVNKTTGRLVSGHQRSKALDASWPIRIEKTFETPDKCGTVARGFIETPFGEIAYRVVEWTEKVEQAAMIAANRHGGEWNDSELKGLLVGLDDGSGLLALTGFDEVDLSGLMDRAGAAAMPETPAESDSLFEQLTFVVTRAQMSEIGFALDQAVKRGPFGPTGNANSRGNALHRIAMEFMK